MPARAPRGARLAEIPGSVPVRRRLAGGLPLPSALPARLRAVPRASTRAGRELGRRSARALPRGGAGAGVVSAAATRRRGGAPLLRVEGLRTWFPIRARRAAARRSAWVRAVDDVDLRDRGRAHAGAGRRVGLRQDDRRALDPAPGRAAGGAGAGSTASICSALPRAALRPLRRQLQIVFQDPLASLDPRMRVRDAIAEGMRAFGIGADEAERSERVARAARARAARSRAR